MSNDAFDSVFKTVNKVFGTEIEYSYLSGGTSTIRGVFDNEFVEIDGVGSRKPILKNVRRSDLTANPVEGDTLDINGVSYTVVESQADSVGTLILILEKT